VYVATPDAADPTPGVVVIHDAAGMSHDLGRQADWLAAAGYLAAAPDLFSWGGTFRCMWQVIRETRAGSGRSFDEIDAVRTWLAARPDCTGRIGVVGFCMGGGFALLLAPRGAFDAASVNYGAAGKDAYTERFLTGSCPIVGSFGRKDPSLRGAAGRLDRALTAIGVEHDVKEYPDASHSFMNDHDPADLPMVFKVTAKLGMRYHEPSAADARHRIVAFFDAHLR
jgi:carboxymethylenebutenolidase